MQGSSTLPSLPVKAEMWSFLFGGLMIASLLFVDDAAPLVLLVYDFHCALVDVCGLG